MHSKELEGRDRTLAETRTEIAIQSYGYFIDMISAALEPDRPLAIGIKDEYTFEPIYLHNQEKYDYLAEYFKPESFRILKQLAKTAGYSIGYTDRTVLTDQKMATNLAITMSSMTGRLLTEDPGLSQYWVEPYTDPKIAGHFWTASHSQGARSLPIEVLTNGLISDQDLTNWQQEPISA